MAFVRGAWKVLVAIKDLLVLIAMLLFFFLLIGLLSNRPDAKQAGQGALLLDINGIIVEEKSAVDPLNLISGGQQIVAEFPRKDLVRAIRGAVEDDDVTALVLDLDRFLGGGQASLAAVAQALSEFKKSDKPIYAYATGYSDDAYQLAAHADEIWLNPQGGIVFTGPGGSRLYYKELIDRLNVTAHVYRVGTFKSAVEPYIRSDQSPEAKQALSGVYEAIWENYKTDIAAARPKAQLASVADNPLQLVEGNGGDLAQGAIDLGLADTLGGRIAFQDHVAKTVGSDNDKRPGSFKHITLPNWLAANAPDTNGEKIAVINIAGTIVDGEAGTGTAGGERIAGLLYDALENGEPKALVVRVDSPGGSVTASEQIREAILAYKQRDIPIVVSMGNLAASGGYWVSTPGDVIFAEPSTITGSIGIFAVLPSVERALAEWGINADGVQTTPLSGQPDFMGGFNDTVDTLLQRNIENGYTRFLTLVAQSRSKSIEQVDQIGQGRIWDGGTARQLGLVDRLGSFEDALAEAAKLAGIEEGGYHASYLETPPDPLSQFLSGFLKPGNTASAPQDLVAKLAWGRQQAIGQVAMDLTRLVSVQGMQAECLECAHFGAPQTRNIAKEGWLSKLLF